MAVGDINTLFKNQIDNLLREIKKGVKEEGTKKAKETALSQLPTPEKIENDFTNLIDKPKKAEQYYTKTKGKLEAVLFKVENARNKLGRLEEKLTKIDKKISDLNDLSKTLSDFIPPIEIAVITLMTTTSPASPAMVTPGAPPGPAVLSLENKIKLVNFASYLISVIGSVADIVETINRTTSSVRGIIPSAIEKIEQLYNYILNLIDLLEKLYINLLLPLLDGYEEIDGGIDNVEDLYNQYPDLQAFLNSEGDVNLSDGDSLYKNGVTNGISNVPPKFFRRYRKNPYTDIY